MTDHLFLVPALGGYWVVAKPAGFEWGPGERDGARFAILRAEEPPASEPDLRLRRKALAAVSVPVEGNVFAAGQLRDCAGEEQFPEEG